MIIRTLDDDLLLITQVDHAALAGRIMAAWRADDFLERPTRGPVLEAAAQHDLGWQSIDAAPGVNPETGAPYGFIDIPLEFRQGVWSVTLDRLAPRDPYVAALVAHHAATVYRRYESTPGWETFFPAMERRRDEWLAPRSEDRDTFLRDYTLVRTGDLWSLAFCTGAREPQEMGGYRATLHAAATATRAEADAGILQAGWLEVTPDPFDGAAVPLEVAARRLPARRYASDADLRETVARAPIVRLAGVASGRPPASNA